MYIALSQKFHKMSKFSKNIKIILFKKNLNSKFQNFKKIQNFKISKKFQISKISKKNQNFHKITKLVTKNIYYYIIKGLLHEYW